MTTPIVKVSKHSNPNSVAGSIAGYIRDIGKVEVHGIGAGALNQAIKAVAISRGFVAPQGIDLICIPAFMEAIVEGEERTVVKLIVEPRQ